MKVEGTYTIHAPREAVWQRLMNLDALTHSLPGCEKLVPNSDGSYYAELKIGVAAVKGNYQGRVEILDPAPPERYRMKVEGKGRGGFVKGEGTLTLSDNAGAATKISYSGDAQVGGVIANVGQRLILAAARQMANHFFQEFAKQIQPSQVSAPPAEAPSPTSPLLAGTGTSTAQGSTLSTLEPSPPPEEPKPAEDVQSSDEATRLKSE